MKRDPTKWHIEKCKRGYGHWHVYGPLPEVGEDEDAWFWAFDGEFRSGDKALAYVRAQVDAG